MDTEEHEELDEDELHIAAQAYALEGKSFAPNDEYLPVCERLVERGWLARWAASIEDEPEDVDVYTMTPEARTAMEVAGMLTDGRERLN